jgi:hypothetical protein
MEQPPLSEREQGQGQGQEQTRQAIERKNKVHDQPYLIFELGQ